MALSWIYVTFGKVGLVAGALLRAEGGGAGDRAAGGGADRPAGAAATARCGGRGGGLRRDLRLRRAVPADRPRRRPDRLGRDARRLGAVPARRAWRGHGRRSPMPTRCSATSRRRMPRPPRGAARAGRARASCGWRRWRRCSLALGPDDVFARLGVFFSQMAVVTFGGAYAVLAYVAQQAVRALRLAAPGEMLDGLGMAETTPGPLILVVQFVGFLAALRSPGGLRRGSPGVLGAVLVAWVTFLPSLPLDLPRRALHRAAARQRRARRRARPRSPPRWSG